jgi:ATP phosphoribosyltransferase regulatory subunit
MPADVLVHGEAGFEMEALNYASTLIEKGLKCENSIFETKEKALEYAKTRGIRRVDCIGDRIETINLT